LSGIRFSYETNDRGQKSLALQYLSFAGVPRLLLYHLSEMLTEDGIKGPAVLMASATSYLAPSPSYHVPVRPNYILRREFAAPKGMSSRAKVASAGRLQAP
jgi:hypothetical protein